MGTNRSYTRYNGSSFNELHAFFILLHYEVSASCDLVLLLFLSVKSANTCIRDCGFNGFHALLQSAYINVIDKVHV